jgi:hypothetical protein
MKKVFTLALAAGMFIALAGIMFSGCTKTGPTGPAGTNGTDANETCKQCHSPSVVDSVAVQYELAKHSYGVVAFEEAGNTGCTPCHAHNAFLYVCQNNIPSTFTLVNGTYQNNYATVTSEAVGSITCFTCHSSLHTTYGYTDFEPFTTTAPVSMTMWAGAKTIDLTQDGSKSNLCVKCHQPRPITCSGPAANNGRVLDYDSLKNFPSIVMYDSGAPSANKWVKPSFRTHNHYGVVGAVYAGVGGVEFSGSLSYSNSPHTTKASCEDCHMAPIYGIAGGHAFNVRNAKESALVMTGTSATTFNFNGCNVSGCHGDSPLDANSAKFKGTRAAVKALLDQLATKLNTLGSGHDILHSTSDPTANLWAGETTGNYDGYLDIYDAGSNPTGYWGNPYGSGATNAGKPKFPSMKFVHMGALINFQFCLREFSLGIHNTQYVTALLTNTLDALNTYGGK